MASGLFAKAGSWATGLEDQNELASNAGQAYAKDKGISIGDTAADAVRHMTMAALAVREHPNWGADIMQAYETFGGGDRRAQRMDEHNNAMGIAAYMDIPEEYRDSMSPEEIAAYMTDIVDKEYQYRLKNEGKPSGEGPKFYEKPLVTDGGYSEGGMVAPTTTSKGRKVYSDEDGENYSEKTITFETSEGWVTVPTVDSEGNQYTQEQLEEFVAENGPIDPLTGNTLPVFETVDEAVAYGQSRSAGLGEEMDAMGLAEGGMVNSLGIEFDPEEAGAMSEDAISLEDFLNFGLDMAPVTGEYRSAQEGIEAYEEGDYVGAALGMAGALPGIGMAGRGVKKGAKAAVEAAEEAAPMFREFFTPLKKTRKGYKPEKPPVLRVEESLDAELNPRLDRAMSADTAGSIMPAPGKFWNPDSRGYKGDKMSQGLRDAGVELDMEYGNYVMMGKGKPQDVTNQTFENLYVTARTSEKKSTGNKNNKSVARANLYDGPSLTIEDMKANYKANTGKTGDEVRTNLLQPERFSVKVGDEFRQLDNPIVAVQPMSDSKKHYYTLDTQFVGPARMDQITKKNRRKQPDGSWKEELPQPNLRPVTVGDVKLGNQVGTIKVGKNEHPLFDYIEVDATAASPAGMGDIPKFNEGGLMSEDETGMPIIGYDEESGNPIPPGSSAENVRDDIPAMLSEGEFVLPADVVKWHGLKHVMEMREEAKEGLMAMHMEDQIKAPTEEVEYEEHDHEEMETSEEEMETSEEETDEHGNEDYPTEMGQMSGIEYGDESLLVLMAADGGEVTSGTDETEKPRQRLVRRLVRDPKTGKMIIMFVDLATGKPVARKSVQEGLADGTMETIDQTPTRMFEEIGGKVSEKSTAEEVIDQETGVSMPSASSSGGSGGDADTSRREPVERTLANNYGFVDPTGRAVAMGVAGMVPFGGLLGSWGINANNTAAVNAARADLGLDPVDTTLGVNVDAATGLVTDQADDSDDISVGPWAADVTMTDQYGKLQRDVADLDKSSIGTQLKNSKVGRFFSGQTPSTETWLQGDGAVSTAGLPYRTSSTLTPSEIAEKKAAGLNYQDGRWGYSQAAENIGLGTFGEMTGDEYGSSSIASTFADEYGLSTATDRGRQEAMGLLSQDMEFFDDDGDGKLSAAEEAEMRDFYESDEPTVTSPSPSNTGSSNSGSSGSSSDGNYTSGSSGGISGNGSDPGDGGGAISSTADGNDWDSFDNDDDWNKGGLIPSPRSFKSKQKYASIKK